MPEKPATIQVGYFVAISITPHIAPLPCYVGQVKAVDERGIRITLMDWLIAKPVGADFFVAWDHIQAAYVGTEDDDYGMWFSGASSFQESIVNPTESPDDF